MSRPHNELPDPCGQCMDSQIDGASVSRAVKASSFDLIESLQTLHRCGSPSQTCHNRDISVDGSLSLKRAGLTCSNVANNSTNRLGFPVLTCLGKYQPNWQMAFSREGFTDDLVKPESKTVSSTKNALYKNRYGECAHSIPRSGSTQAALRQRCRVDTSMKFHVSFRETSTLVSS